MRYLVFSCSLNPVSNSRVLARRLERELSAAGAEIDFADLQEIELPFCDGGESYNHPNVVSLQARIEAADGIAIATPIYNYETGGATRNLIALGGKSWNHKTVGFLCAAGGHNSFMSVMPLAVSLMLDFRCIVIPRYVYAARSAFDGDSIADAKIEDRVAELANELDRVTRALSAAGDND